MRANDSNGMVCTQGEAAITYDVTAAILLHKHNLQKFGRHSAKTIKSRKKLIQAVQKAERFYDEAWIGDKRKNKAA